MLRKKLSKLIVSIMTVAVISGGMGVGQTAFASSNTEVVVTQNSRVAVTDETTMLNALNDPTNANVELKLEITNNINLTEEIIKVINARTAPLTIEVQQNGVLTIGTGFTQAVTLDGLNSNLTVVRGAGKTGTMLVQNSGFDVVIQNIDFDNAGQAESVFSTDGKSKTTLRSNKLVDTTVNENSSLVLQDNSINLSNIVFDKNILNTGKLLSAQTLDITLNSTPGATVISFSGSVDATKNTKVNVRSGKATIRVKDSMTSLEVKEVANIPINVTTDASGVFTGGTFSAVVDGLTPNKQYNVELLIEVLDDGNNEYVRVQNLTNVSTINFSTTVTNIGSNSATININNLNVPNLTYPLTITVTGTATVNPTSITSSTNSVSLTGLAAGTSYTYEIKSGSTVIDKGTFKTTSSTISGNAGSGSVTTGDLTSSDINKSDIKDVSASIPVGNTTLLNSLKNGKDYKTNIEGVSVTFTNDKLEVTGLVPGKDYKDLTITYTDKDGRTRTVKVPTFKTKTSETKLRQFIVDVYSNSLSRTPDEKGFAYWEDQLKNKKTTPEEFVKNLLNEKEFIEKHKTTTEKIEALYKVIVNRSSDSQGLSYWTTKYDDLVKKGYSESMALKVTVDEMVNEQEFKNRVKDLGL